MKKLVVVVEGVDGSGKGTLIKKMRSMAEERDISVRVIGRKGGDAGEVSDKITNIVQKHANELTLEADFHLRLAREYQRAKMASEEPAGLVILDRFVISVLSRTVEQGIDLEEARRQLSNPFRVAGVMVTVHVECPYEMAWARVIHGIHQGEREMSPKEKRGEEYHRRLGERMEAEFEMRQLTGKLWHVDNSGTLEAAERQITGYMESWLTAF